MSEHLRGRPKEAETDSKVVRLLRTSLQHVSEPVSGFLSVFPPMVRRAVIPIMEVGYVGAALLTENAVFISKSAIEGNPVTSEMFSAIGPLPTVLIGGVLLNGVLIGGAQQLVRRSSETSRPKITRRASAVLIAAAIATSADFAVDILTTAGLIH